MTRREARAIIAALEGGGSLEIAAYAAGVREVLDLDRATGRFTVTRHDAYSPDVERSSYTREELEALLRSSFTYASFRLPPPR